MCFSSPSPWVPGGERGQGPAPRALVESARIFWDSRGAPRSRGGAPEGRPFKTREDAKKRMFFLNRGEARPKREEPQEASRSQQRQTEIMPGTLGVASRENYRNASSLDLRRAVREKRIRPQGALGWGPLDPFRIGPMRREALQLQNFEKTPGAPRE